MAWRFSCCLKCGELTGSISPHHLNNIPTPRVRRRRVGLAAGRAGQAGPGWSGGSSGSAGRGLSGDQASQEGQADGWSRLVRRPGWRLVSRVGRVRLVEAGQATRLVRRVGRVRLVEAGQGWVRLVEAGQPTSSLSCFCNSEKREF